MATYDPPQIVLPAVLPDEIKAIDPSLFTEVLENGKCVQKCFYQPFTNIAEPGEPKCYVPTYTLIEKKKVRYVVPEGFDAPCVEPGHVLEQTIAYNPKTGEEWCVSVFNVTKCALVDLEIPAGWSSGVPAPTIEIKCIECDNLGAEEGGPDKVLEWPAGAYGWGYIKAYCEVNWQNGEGQVGTGGPISVGGCRLEAGESLPATTTQCGDTVTLPAITVPAGSKAVVLVYCCA